MSRHDIIDLLIELGAQAGADEDTLHDILGLIDDDETRDWNTHTVTGLFNDYIDR